MKMLATTRVFLVVAAGLLMACASGRKESTAAPKSDDLLELLTGFGESLSKHNYSMAVDYMVPEEKALLLEGGQVPAEKQRMLMALPLQKLIRHPAVRVVDGKIAGISTLLPNLRQGTDANLAAVEPDTDEGALPAEPTPTDEMALASSPLGDGTDEMAEALPKKNDPQLKQTISKFFMNVNRKNWNDALALVNEDEKRMLLDDKGQLKESAKLRLSQIDQKNREALVMQDGKLAGVTLLLPTE